MTIQTSYPLAPVKGYAGQLADLNDTVKESRSCETSAGIGFGLVVSPGTDEEKQCVLGGDATGFGITIRDMTKANPSSGDPKYAENDAVSICRGGVIYAPVATAAVAGTALKYDDTTGAIDSGAAGSGETAMSNCELISAVANDGDVGAIKINPASTL